jgi:LmbE family N-acetylglucosaminyl deacetylase
VPKDPDHVSQNRVIGRVRNEKQMVADAVIGDEHRSSRQTLLQVARRNLDVNNPIVALRPKLLFACSEELAQWLRKYFENFQKDA